MVKWLFKHQWKRWARSTIWQKSLVLNIVIGVLLLLVILDILFIGIMIDKILIMSFPDQDPVVKFNGFLLYYFMIDLVLRFYIQGLPTIVVESYLHLPVKRNRLIHFLLSESAFGIFNFIPLLIMVPFSIKVIALGYSGGIAIVWIISMFLLLLSNTYLVTYLKRQLFRKPFIIGIVAIILGSLIALEYFNLISITSFSSLIFGYLLKEPLLILIPLLWFFIMYLGNFYYLKARLYPDEVRPKRRKKIDAISNIKYFDSLGHLGDLVTLELKLLWRNKRPKSILPLSPVFLLYGFIFYTQDYYLEYSGILIFAGMFMTGGLMLNYGQFLLAWESNYFDAILTNNIDFNKYFRVKFLVCLFLCGLFYILTLPYAFFGIKILIINTSVFLFNIGFVSFLVMYLSCNNRKRIDLSKKATFNYEGMGATQWLTVLMFFLLPVLIYLPFGLLHLPYLGLALIAITGILGLIFNQQLLDLTVKRFESRKYKIAEGFRQR